MTGKLFEKEGFELMAAAFEVHSTIGGGRDEIMVLPPKGRGLFGGGSTTDARNKPTAMAVGKIQSSESRSTEGGMGHPGVEGVGGPRKRACGDLRHTQPMRSEAGIPRCSFSDRRQDGAIGPARSVSMSG